MLLLIGTPLAFAAGVVGTFWLRTRGPRDAAHAFAHAVHERHFDRARRMLVDDLQAEITPEAFRASFEDSQYAHREDLTFSSASMSDATACLEGNVNTVDVTFRLRHTEGEWRIASVERGHGCPRRGTAFDALRADP